MASGRVGQIPCDTDPATGLTRTWLTTKQRALFADAKSIAAKARLVDERSDQNKAYDNVAAAIGLLLRLIPPERLPGSENELKTDKKAPADGAPDA